jgi:dCMP deaminase
MSKHNKFDKVMIETAKIWAELSPCKRLKVGAVLSKDNRILANGYNGTITGAENICECYEKFKNIDEIQSTDSEIKITCPVCKGSGEISLKGTPYNEECGKCDGHGSLKSLNKTNDLTLHAEQNIISFCAKNGISTEGATMYLTHAPCKQCSKLIAQSGIKTVYYNKKYKTKEGIKFLEENGVKVWKT